MSPVWKVLIALALVVPMVAYVAGSLVASAADDPAPRETIQIREPTRRRARAGLRPRAVGHARPTPSQPADDDDVEVITPTTTTSTTDDDRGDDDGDDHSGHGGGGGDDDDGDGDDDSGHGGED